MEEKKCNGCIWGCSYEEYEEEEVCDHMTPYQQDYTYSEPSLLPDSDYWEEWNIYISEFN